jgi:hypothetical protein
MVGTWVKDVCLLKHSKEIIFRSIENYLLAIRLFNFLNFIIEEFYNQ